MAYQELKKLYYQNEEEYVKEYQRRFDSEDTCRIDFQIGNYPAFFTENTKVLRLALNIAQLDKKLLMLSDQLPPIAKHQYSNKCMIDEIVLTNRIEGVYSSRKEIGEVLDILEKQSEIRHSNSRFLGLVSKYRKLMSKEKIPLISCQDIRDIYDELFLDEVIMDDPKNQPDGKIFRKGSESIYSEAGKEIHKGVYPEEKIISCMEQALNFLNDDSVQYLYRICVFHYLFEYIHPFYDGNGRLGRFILSYCISKELEPLLSYCISETIKESIGNYYKAFSTCNNPLNRGDLTPFLIMQLEMIKVSMTDLKVSLEEKIQRRKKYDSFILYWIKKGEKNMAGIYNLLIQASLFSEDGISTKELMQELDIKSVNTLKKLIDLIPSEMLCVQMKRRTNYYQFNLSYLDEVIFKETGDKMQFEK